ncbi:MAG TPA: phytanoyl-CoA dioxygenase family protein, partial [Candidatus Sulfotelmatobacter sp.]|nr:phytanoyl-CoA dioxygenase family protein [Candidatus Sulfotelmatobacter sp.]
AYQDDGFVIVQDLLGSALLSQLRDDMDKVTGGLETLPPRLKEKIFLERDHVRNNPQWYKGVLAAEECGGAVRQIADLGLFAPTFAELIVHPPLSDVLEALFASPEFSFTYMVGRPKAARVGNGISNGNFHRDAPFEDTTSTNTVIAILCLDAMTGENGGTSFIRGSHKVSDAEAADPRWRDVAADRLDLGERVDVRCLAGSGVFFSSKVLHAAGHNRSDHPRRTILSEWAGPGVLPTSPVRYAYQGLRPGSKDPLYQRQTRMTFPQLFGGQAKG